MQRLLHEPESLARVACAAPEQAQADDAVAYNHDRGENCVAGQTRLFRRRSNHYGDYQCDLDDRDGDGEYKRPERFAGSKGDHLGVIDRSENGCD
jgi:hypothetical protein